jgi:hypothetical protein
MASGQALASDVRLIGGVGYSYTGNTVTLTAGAIQNLSAGTTGTLRLELWALPAPYAGGSFTGYKLAEYSPGFLNGGYEFNNISVSVPFSYPPNGTYALTMFLTEYIGASYDDGFTVRDYRNFSGTETFGPVGPPPPAFTPQIGLWWNPAESGTGYAIDFKHGVLVMTVYSYATNGLPQWYIAYGPMSAYTWTGTLLKTLNGQCISCAYTPAVGNGNDGTVTVVFSSPTAGTMYLPGGRVTQIQPEAF